MSIKQSIASLVILLSVSFSANASVMKVNGWSGYIAVFSNCFGISSGSYVDPQGVGSCVGRSFMIDGREHAVINQRSGSYSLEVKHRYFKSGRWNEDWSRVDLIPVSGGCPDGQELIDGVCKEPPPPFCERPDTIQQMDDFRQACYQMGSGFSPDVSCSDATESLDMFCDAPPPQGCTPDSSSWPACKDDENKCDENDPDWNPEYGMCCRPENNWCDVPAPESCVIGGVNWPACADDIDVDPPTGGDLGDPDKPSGGGGGGSTDPDKPEPDVDNTSDTLAAIKAMNKDVNSQLTGINNDMNKNQAETKSALDALKASVDLNTDTVVDNANHVANAINGQSDMLSDIGNNTNHLLTSANHLLNDGFAQLANRLDGVEATNQKGFGDVVDAIEGLGKPMVDGGGGGAVVPLYSATQLHNLNAEITVLKNEYKDLLNQYRAYFNFTSDVNGGDYNAHNIELTVRGNVVRQQNAVMAALQDNAGIIGAVVLFVFGLLGIRAIGGAF
ncbi:chemotaxis protein [Vibrio parahaemolyticus]|uniref:chemotaxis protein n=1 Tax=Vibrio parahaemolyticus TaxID=670 RepID=UPI0005C2211E|nr:chemotaxis protein [Vibrio parahaemolyticus]KIV01820.1 chemotaxis protein [Vibrio parahaemolyticus]